MWRLDKTLTKLYAEARDKNGEMYKKTTLTSYRQGIQRHLDAMRDDKIDSVKGIRVITKLPNSEQSYKGKVKTHKYINRQNQSTTGKLKTVMTLTWYRHF